MEKNYASHTSSCKEFSEYYKNGANLAGCYSEMDTVASSLDPSRGRKVPRQPRGDGTYRGFREAFG